MGELDIVWDGKGIPTIGDLREAAAETGAERG